MAQLKEWQRHVKRGDSTWCGVTPQSFGWLFVNRAHAEAAVAQNTRVQPCPDCYLAMATTFEPTATYTQPRVEVD